MTPFILFAYLASIAMLAMQLRQHPHLIMRPSFWFCLGLATRIGGAAAFDAVPMLGLHKQPEVVRLLPVLFPFGVAVWIALTPRLSTRTADLYTRCRDVGAEWARNDDFLLQRAALASGLILSVYFLFVPPSSTGIVAILTNPLNAAAAREESLKLVGFAPVRYAFIWHMKLFAPVVACLLLLKPMGRTPTARLFKFLLLFLMIVSVSLSGARSPAGLMILTLAFAYLLRAGVLRSVPVLVGAVTAVIVIAASLTILREGRATDLSPGLILDVFERGIFARIFVVPFKSGVMTTLYVQDYGLMGVSNIRPLALLFGVQYVQLPNLVGLAYMTSRIMSVSANTCALFDFQASFGLLGGWAFSLAAVCSLDWLIIAFNRLRGPTLVALYAAFMTAQHTLISSAFFTCLASHGILLIAFAAWYVGRRWGRPAVGPAQRS